MWRGLVYAEVALEIVNMFPDLALHKDVMGKYALQDLARKPLKPQSTQGSSWTKWISKFWFALYKFISMSLCTVNDRFWL